MARKVLKRSGRIRPGPISAAETKKRTDLIIGIATEEFLSRGFEGVTLSAIAARCRISKTTLYSLFESKEALFSHVASATIEGFNYDLEQVLDLHRPFEAVIRDVVRIMIENTKLHTANSLLRLVVAEGERFQLLGRQTLERTFDLLRPLGDYLRSVPGGRRLSKKGGLVLAYHLMSLAVGGFGCLLVDPEDLYGDAKVWTDTVASLFSAGFFAGNSRHIAIRLDG
jgi:AcrR family transcriptional regulator